MPPLGSFRDTFVTNSIKTLSETASASSSFMPSLFTASRSSRKVALMIISNSWRKGNKFAPPQRTAEHSRESHHLASLSDTCGDVHLERVGTWSIMTLWPSLKCHEWPEQDSQTLSEPECIWLLPPTNLYPKSIPFHLSTWAGFIFLQLCITSTIWGTPRWADRLPAKTELRQVHFLPLSPFPLPAFHSSSHSLILLNDIIVDQKIQESGYKNKQRHTLRHTKVSISTYPLVN